MDDLLRDWCEGPVAETYLCFPKPCPLSFQGLGRLEEVSQNTDLYDSIYSCSKNLPLEPK